MFHKGVAAAAFQMSKFQKAFVPLTEHGADLPCIQHVMIPLELNLLGSKTCEQNHHQNPRRHCQSSPSNAETSHIHQSVSKKRRIMRDV